MNSIDIFAKFCSERNIRKGTVKSYRTAIMKYEEFVGKDIYLVISDALKEVDERVPLKDRAIKRNLIEYRSFLLDSGMSTATVKTYFSKLKTFLKHFEVEIPLLPEVKYEKSYETCYLDLPTREQLAQAVNMVPIDLKAIILFMCSSGTAKAETLSLTIDDFFNATAEYHNGGTTTEILDSLSLKSNIIPTFYLKRIKTDKYYYTFCSPEASSCIVEYLKIRDDFVLSDPLFEFTDAQLLTKFQAINDELNWGFKGRYRFFRSHVLRKFHASNIGLLAEHVDALQGRGRSPIHEAYIKTNPKDLKELYAKVVDNVTILKPHQVPDTINEEFNIVINVFISDQGYNII